MKQIITLLIVCCSNMYAQDTFIHAGKIFDSKSGKTKKEKTMLYNGYAAQVAKLYS